MNSVFVIAASFIIKGTQSKCVLQKGRNHVIMGNTPSSHKISSQDRYGKPFHVNSYLILTIKTSHQSHPRHEKPTRQAPPIPAPHHRNHLPRSSRSSRMPRTGREIQSAPRPPPKKVPGNPPRENRRPTRNPRATDEQR